MDLNIVIHKDNSRDSRELIVRKIKAAYNLGYRTVALSVQLTPDQVTAVPDPPVIELASSEKMKIQILTRLTVSIEDSLQTHRLSQSPAFKKYDLIAIEPLNQKMLNHICGGHYDCEIITFSMKTRLPVDIKTVNFGLPRSRGICFEINYSDALSNQTNRQNVISSGQLLVDKNKGKNILLSSGAQTCIALRGSYDVANMGLLFCLKENQAKEAVFKTGMKAIKHAEMRRNINSNAVTVSAVLEPQEKWLFEEFKSRRGVGSEDTGEDVEEPVAKKKKQ